jgi:hypothetical protein
MGARDTGEADGRWARDWFSAVFLRIAGRFWELQMRLCPLSRAQCSSHQQEEIYFFLAAFFLPPFFFADFFALVAIVISLHVELVRAQYIHKLKMASKC